MKPQVLAGPALGIMAAAAFLAAAPVTFDGRARSLIIPQLAALAAGIGLLLLFHRGAQSGLRWQQPALLVLSFYATWLGWYLVWNALNPSYE